MAPALATAGVNYSLLSFPGSGHVPWDTNTIIMNRSDSAVAAFFYQVKCTQAAGHCNEPTGIDDIALTSQVNIFPNPVTNHIQIAILDQNELSLATLYDYTGREISRIPISGKDTSISVAGLASGLYILQINMKDKNIIPITRKIQIE